ncbi:hypothetical protein ACFX15_010290 [Malus domestica]
MLNPRVKVVYCARHSNANIQPLLPSQGKGIFMFKTGSIKEVIKEGTVGHVVVYNDTLSIFLAESDERDEVGMAELA